MRRSIFAVALCVGVIGLSAPVPSVHAQPYPNRPIQLIIPGAPGSILDIVGRLIGDELGKSVGTQFIPIDKPGAGFTLGTDFVAKSKKDGYTLAYTNSAAIVYGRVLNPETVPYDPDKDLEPLGLHLFLSEGIAVQQNAPWKSFKELLEYAKKNPGKLRVSTTGIGSSAHFTLEVLQSLTGTEFTHVPFKGGESVVTALLGGHVDMTFDAVTKLAPHVESGKMRLLLLDTKMPEFPDVPSLKDFGYRHEASGSWFAMYGPAGLPEEAKKVLVPAIEKAIKNPEVKAKVEKMFFVVDYKSPAELKKIAAEQYERVLALAKKVGLRK